MDMMYYFEVSHGIEWWYRFAMKFPNEKEVFATCKLYLQIENIQFWSVGKLPADGLLTVN